MAKSLTEMCLNKVALWLQGRFKKRQQTLQSSNENQQAAHIRVYSASSRDHNFSKAE